MLRQLLQIRLNFIVHFSICHFFKVYFKTQPNEEYYLFNGNPQQARGYVFRREGIFITRNVKIKYYGNHCRVEAV